MKTVWKFRLEPEILIDMPTGAELLSVHGIGHDIFVWALVDPDALTEERRFLVFGTGHAIHDDMSMRFVGTAILDGGSLVFHVFEKVEGE